MRAGFTILEIIISVMIISIFAITMASTGAKNKRIYEFLNNKIEVTLPASIALDTDASHNDNIFVSDVVQKNYKINNDTLRKLLKEKKYIYKKPELKNEDELFSLQPISVEGNHSRTTIYSFKIKDISLLLDSTTKDNNE